MKEILDSGEAHPVISAPYLVVWNGFPQDECDSWSEARSIAIACAGTVFRRYEKAAYPNPDPKDWLAFYGEVEHRCYITGKFVAERL